jgi:seryl-tRNA synthetase
VSWFRDYQARRAGVRYRAAGAGAGAGGGGGGGGGPQFVHTVNGSALAWPRIWAALVETGRQADGTVVLPDVLGPYIGGELLLKAP